jgi:hypothetical protein
VCGGGSTRGARASGRRVELPNMDVHQGRDGARCRVSVEEGGCMRDRGVACVHGALRAYPRSLLPPHIRKACIPILGRRAYPY